MKLVKMRASIMSTYLYIQQNQRMLLAYWISFVKSLVLGGFVTFDVICQFSPLKARSRLLRFYTCTVAEYCKRHKSAMVRKIQ